MYRGMQVALTKRTRSRSNGPSPPEGATPGQEMPDTGQVGRSLFVGSLLAEVAAARSGDEAAMERLLLPHEASLRATCRGILGRPDEADDAVQETFLRALRHLERYRGEASFKTWLTRIAINVCLDWKRARRPQMSLQDWEAREGEVAALATGAIPSPEAQVIDQMLLAAALGILSPRRRAAFVLREAEGWSDLEIAAVTGWSAARVKVELYRTRRALAAWGRRRRQQEREHGEEEQKR